MGARRIFPGVGKLKVWDESPPVESSRFTPFVGVPFFVNSKWCGIDVVRPAYVGELSYDRS